MVPYTGVVPAPGKALAHSWVEPVTSKVLPNDGESGKGVSVLTPLLQQLPSACSIVCFPFI